VKVSARRDRIERQVVARVELVAIDRERVHALPRVKLSTKPVCRAAVPITPNDDYVPVPTCPLALNAREYGADLEDEVVRLITKRSGDAHAET
jgi:hypothetical protein